MKVIGFVGFMMISVIGTWSQSDLGDNLKGPDVASFLPGGDLPHSPDPDDNGCN